jgi:hypothetical protein
LNPDLENYLADVIRILLDVSPESAVRSQQAPIIQYLTSDYLLAQFDFEIFYLNTFRLSISMILDWQEGFPDWYAYRFHFQREADGTTVFRYDNSRRHLDLPNFPHHKHVGPEETPEGSDQPTIHQIAREIQDYLETQERPPSSR